MIVHASHPRYGSKFRLSAEVSTCSASQVGIAGAGAEFDRVIQGLGAGLVE